MKYIPQNVCIWPDCEEPTQGTWFCRKHYLEKEAAYAEYDIRHNPEFLKTHKDWTLERILSLAEYRQNG